ncbi:nuclease-related domain-containing protein [Nocardia carnea]|uniref:nuclease-related domain-containing protein n=1 Tax=Nocardia carnea TaxID=37328 RepID=UPI0005C229D4|nr:nuclease-related domain-containing protein [Nocardia carnea]
MLVIADKLRSGAEKRVVSWLRKWQDDYRVPGVAIANCFVSGQEVDLVIITPHTTVVCEIKGLNPGVTSGVLHCTSNSRWKVSGFDGDPVGVRQNDTTPYDQVRDGVFKVKNAAARAGGPAFVTGLVVVVPPRGSNLRLDKKSAPQGCDVLLCNTQNPLRAWFHRAHHRAAVVWTAEQAYALIEALEHGDSTSVAGLAAEGFPMEAPPQPAAPLSAPLSAPAAPVTTPSGEAPPKPEIPIRPPVSRPPLPPPVPRPDAQSPAPAQPPPPPQHESPAPEPAEPIPVPPTPAAAPPRPPKPFTTAVAAVPKLPLPSRRSASWPPGSGWWPSSATAAPNHGRPPVTTRTAWLPSRPPCRLHRGRHRRRKSLRRPPVSHSSRTADLPPRLSRLATGDFGRLEQTGCATAKILTPRPNPT